MIQYLRTLLSAIALTALVTSTVHAAEDTSAPKAPVQLASDVWPPFTNHFGKPRLATELTHVALKRSGYAPATEILDHWTVPADVKAGKYDGCGAIWKSAEREEYLLYSKPYLESRLHLVGQKGSDVSISDLSKLKGKRLALVKGYAYGPIVDNATGVTIVYGNDDVENLKMLVSDDADYTLVDELLIQHAKKEKPETCEKFLEFGTTSLATNPLHLAVRKNLPNAVEIIKEFDQAIRMMQADGTYNRVLRLNSIAIDIDDDGVKELVLADINLEVGTITSGYDVYSNNKSLPEKKRYSIRDTIYNGWDEVPDDYRSMDDVIPDTRKEGFSLFGGDF
jgi:polar amino acid transport system substrate-binding protein